MFRDPSLTVFHDVSHSLSEEHHIAIGKNVSGRLLLVGFTMRDGKIRPISFRKLNDRERERSMIQKPLKKAPILETEEEFAQWMLTTDLSDYIDWDKGYQPNIATAEESVNITLPAADLSQITSLASSSKKSLAEMLSVMVLHTLKELRANPSLHL